jgi:hypothetical protein
VAPGVSPREYRRAARVRPGAASTREVTALLDAAGFVDVRKADVTKTFARTTRAYIETTRRFEDELRTEWGTETFDERQLHWSSTLTLVEQGILRRSIFTAKRPAR